MRLKKTILVAAVISMAMSSTAFAGTWKTEDGANQGRRWYDNGNGTYPKNSWQWLDGNGDGVAECYYFDSNGWLLVNTTTPDGYTVNGDGAWVQSGSVQTKVAPISENDFVVSGSNSVTRNTTDNSIISNWVHTGYSADPTPYHVFISGDSLTTARGISFGASKNDVLAKYGNTDSKSFDATSDKWYQFMLTSGYAEANTIVTSNSVIEYFSNPYGIRFYFDKQEQLSGVVYYRDSTMSNNSSIQNNTSNNGVHPTKYIGNYSYSGGHSFIFNNQTETYEVLAETANESEDEWFNKIYPADPAYGSNGFSIKEATDQAFLFEAYDDVSQFLKHENGWVYDINGDGVLQELEINGGLPLELLEDGRVAISFEYFIDEENENYHWPANSKIKITSYYTKNE